MSLLRSLIFFIMINCKIIIRVILVIKKNILPKSHSFKKANWCFGEYHMTGVWILQGFCNNNFLASLQVTLKQHLDKEILTWALSCIHWQSWVCIVKADVWSVTFMPLSSGIVCVCFWCNALLAVSLTAWDILVQCDLKHCILEMGGGQDLKQDLT